MKDRACGIIIRNNKVMFIKQRMGSEFSHVFVGGGVEDHETPEEAVIRELGEEANVKGAVVFGPVTVMKKRMEHMFIIDIPDNLEPFLGYDPELPANDQVITNILWYDADGDTNKFTDIDKKYFALVCDEARKQNIRADWLDLLIEILNG